MTRFLQSTLFQKPGGEGGWIVVTVSVTDKHKNRGQKFFCLILDSIQYSIAFSVIETFSCPKL